MRFAPLANAPELSLEMPREPFQILMPEEGVKAPILVTVTHSGRFYPPEFLKQTRLDLALLRQSEDAYIDWLIGKHLPFPVLIANAARTYIDLNRNEKELDPLLIAGDLPEDAMLQSQRVQAGLGVVPRVANGASEIYQRKLSLAEARERIAHHYWPFHHEIEKILQEMNHCFGQSLIIDCHSMPSTNRAHMEADIILGDNFGSSCASAITDFVEHFFQNRRANVRRNIPYAGGYITQHYGRPSEHQHVLQIELNRRLYMNERNLEPGPGFLDVHRQMQDFFAALMQQWEKLLR